MTTPDFPISDTPASADFLERLRAVTEFLEMVVGDRSLLAGLPREDRLRLVAAAGQVYSPDLDARRQLVKATHRLRKKQKVKAEEDVLAGTGIRRLRRQAVFTTPNYFLLSGPPPESVLDPERPHQAGDTSEPQNCYVCKQDFTAVHHFYDQLCPACAAFNFAKRTELADLRGRVALLTGGRVKIGYQAGLKLLRCGAHLIVTTRFPCDSAKRFGQEPDFAEWSNRLEIYGLDLRHTPSVEEFCRHLLRGHDRLDFIINNACQTVRRPPEFYRHMMDGEAAGLGGMPEPVRHLLGAYEGLRGYHILPEGAETPAPLDRQITAAPGLTHSAQLSQVPLLPEDHPGEHDLFPVGRLDQDLQQIDLRERNSWRLLMAEVPSVELLEVQLVNAIAPYILNARLKPLMVRTPGREKHIVNVSAVEGQFYRRFKTTRHPHTNMAKAALNMMTRTASADYIAEGIHMNSVDTGWVTDEDPAEDAERKILEHRFSPPLDIIDGAARIVDPIIAGLNTGQHVWGQFLKDYKPTDW